MLSFGFIALAAAAVWVLSSRLPFDTWPILDVSSPVGFLTEQVRILTQPKEEPYDPDYVWHDNDIHDLDSLTIYQALSQCPRFTRLVAVIDFAGEEVVNLLNDTTADITFFAVPNSALKPPKRRHQVPSLLDADAPEELLHGQFVELLSQIDTYETAIVKPDKEKWKKIIKKIVTAVIKYHTIPQKLDSQTLAQNSTYPTEFTYPGKALGGRPQRLRVRQLPLTGALTVNVISEVIKADIKTKNGIIHVIKRPLLPPIAVFKELFIFPGAFSVLTSALQRVNLTDALDLHWVHGEDPKKGELEGAPAVTFFAPSNKAFHRLPRKLLFFLFSPFGERALKKLLQFHLVPGAIVHSDYVYNVTAEPPQETIGQNPGAYEQSSHHLEVAPSDFEDCHPEHSSVFELQSTWTSDDDEDDDDHPRRPRYPRHPRHPPDPRPPRRRRPHFPPGKVVSSFNLTAPTALENHTLSLHAIKYEFKLPFPRRRGVERYTNLLFVNGQRTILPDVVASNGAVHVVHKLINPHPRHPRKRHDRKPKGDADDVRDEWEDEWEDWEDWLPRWAME